VGNDNVASIGKGPEFFRYRIVVFPAHDDVMPFGSLHEELHIIRQVPGQVIVFTDDMVLTERGD
jgi:hypothetical protein